VENLYLSGCAWLSAINFTANRPADEMQRLLDSAGYFQNGLAFNS
jgi:hypothetical protein